MTKSKLALNARLYNNTWWSTIARRTDSGARTCIALQGAVTTAAVAREPLA